MNAAETKLRQAVDEAVERHLSPWKTMRQAAKYIGFSYCHFQTRIYRAGKIRGHCPPGSNQPRFHTDELDDYVRGKTDNESLGQTD